MKRVAIFLLVCLIAIPVVAQQAPQLKTPRPSPKASLTQTVGITDITISYSRPGVKGREIWGGLVPYDKVWRTGANEATTISFSEDVMIGGQKLAKGMYSLHTIPGKDEWTVIFNSVADQWGSYSYDAAKDALRVKAKPQKADFREWMGFEVQEMNSDKATIAFRWENVAVPFTVDAMTTERVKTSAAEAVKNSAADDWQTPYRAAGWAFDAKLDDLAGQWIDQSVKRKETMANLFLRARMYERAGKKADAVKAGELALARMTDKDNKDFAAEIKKTVEGWKK